MRKLLLLILIISSCNTIKNRDEAIYKCVYQTIDTSLEKKKFEKLESLHILAVDSLDNKTRVDLLTRNYRSILKSDSEMYVAYQKYVNEYSTKYEDEKKVSGRKSWLAEHYKEMSERNQVYLERERKNIEADRKTIDSLTLSLTGSKPNAFDGFIVKAAYIVNSSLHPTRTDTSSFVITKDWIARWYYYIGDPN